MVILWHLKSSAVIITSLAWTIGLRALLCMRWLLVDTPGITKETLQAKFLKMIFSLRLKTTLAMNAKISFIR
ncbi:hypothetical protein F5887DRAFT_1013149 [Amanita rubescens]|nr:hypothetical protein F5887DRAFT_1013149 [Amanita rubescens]